MDVSNIKFNFFLQILFVESYQVNTLTFKVSTLEYILSLNTPPNIIHLHLFKHTDKSVSSQMRNFNGLQTTLI